MVLRLWENVRKWTPTLRSELPLWELESRWTFKFSKNNCRGKNSLNFLECRFLKWARMTHLGSWYISYGQKKGHESNCQFDSQWVKVNNRPDFLVCRWRATYHWKALDEGYNFALDLTSIRGFHRKLWVSKVVGVSILGILGLPLGSPKTKWDLGARPMTRHKEYYKGKVVASPKFGPWWVLWVRVYPWFIRAPKVF
jgi:hypothetical protein